jgi:hypothetical protein
VSQQPFGERMFEEFHRLVPDVDLVVLPQPKERSMFGVHGAQVEQQSTAAMNGVLRTLAELWPLLTCGLPTPPIVRTGWQQEDTHPSAVVAFVTARHNALPTDRIRRVAAAHAALIEAGWDARRRDPRFPRYLRLLAERGRTAVEVSAHSRPDSYIVEVRYGPVLVGRFGEGLLAGPTERIRFPTPGGPAPGRARSAPAAPGPAGPAPARPAPLPPGRGQLGQAR